MVIGYTTGVFDLFHIGHLNILKQASQMCDRLIVGVSSDELVLHYKERYPIIPLSERLEIVKSIRYVDEVYIQRDINKVLAHEKLKFNIIFHGNDWQNTDLYKKMEIELKLRGVEIVYFEYTSGISTTEIKQKIYKLM